MPALKDKIRYQIFQILWHVYCQVGPRIGRRDHIATEAMGKSAWINTYPWMDKIGDWLLDLDPYNTKTR